MTIKQLQRPFEVKEVADNGVFKGYGSVFGELDSYRDIVMPGAFKDSLQNDFAAKNRKVPMLWQHNQRAPIGVYTTIKEDAHGLYVEGEINMDVQQGREAYALMKQGALSGLSIGYETIGEEWDKENLVSKLTKLKLYEVSPVTFPAGDSARIATVKSIEALTSISECEQVLRDAGLSRKEAATLISRIKSIPAQRDAGDAEPDIGITKAMQLLRSITIPN